MRTRRRSGTTRTLAKRPKTPTTTPARTLLALLATPSDGPRYAPLVPASVRYQETLERRKQVARAFVDPEAPRASFRQKLRLIELYEWWIAEVFAYVIKTIHRRAAEGTLTRAHIAAVRTFLKEAAALKEEGKA